MSTFNLEALKESLKRINFCQPMNESTIINDFTSVVSVLASLSSATELDDQFFIANFTLPAKHFLLFELPFLASKYVIEFRSFSNITNINNGKLILSYAIRLSLKETILFPEATKPFETIKYILDPDRQHFKFNQQIEFDDTQFINVIHLSPEQTDFCDQVKENDFVDALKFDIKSQVIDWSRAKVYKVTERFVHVKFLGDTIKRKISRYSYDIAPFKSKVPDEEWDWRFTLNPDDIIDCPDDTVWYNSTIIEKEVMKNDDDTGIPIISYKVGFRIYQEDGPSLDINSGRHFYGWNNQYDEELRATNPRIQKLNKFSKAFCKYASMSYAEESIKDYNDFLYESDKPIYAVPRFNTRTQRRSAMMIELIQLFGENNGFTIILDRISNTKQWCPIDHLSLYIATIGQLNEMLPRKFCYQYIPQLWEVVKNNLLNSPDSNLRNFTTQKISDTLNGMGLLLKRVYSLREKTEMIDKLEMKISLKCFNSDFLERKLQGLKSIQELIKRTKDYQQTMQNSDIKFLTPQLMVDWINQNKIFEQLYVSQSNSHIIQRSSEFFKFMLDEKLLTPEHIAMVWAGVNSKEVEVRLAVYKLLRDVSSSLDKEHLDYFIVKICEKDATNLVKDDIELLNDLTKYNYRYREEFCLKFCNYYWSLLINSKQNRISQQMIDQLMHFYIDVRSNNYYFSQQVSSFEMKVHRSDQLGKICEAIEQNQNLSMSIKLLIKFIEKLDIQPYSWDNFTRNQALTQFELKNHLVDSVLKSLSQLKELFTTSDPQYIEEVKIRMEFIQFFYTQIQTNELRLSFSVISQLWDQLVCRSVTSTERELLYKWFSTLSQGQSLTSMVETNDLKNFFDSKMTGEQKNLIELTKEGFNCFKTVFIAINHDNFNEVPQNENEHQTQYNNFYNYQPLVKAEDENKLIVTQDPLKLYGFNHLWTIIIDSEDEQVARIAIEFLHSLYENIDKTVELETSQLAYIFQQIEQFQYHEEKKLYRVLLVLEDSIDQSEVNGSGTLKSLIALAPSEEVSITVINEANNGPFLPKKITIQILENQQIIELRYMIQKQLRIPWDNIALQSVKGEIKFSENGKMVKDLRLKKGENIIASRRVLKEPPEKELLNEDLTLTSEGQTVFEEIFNEYSQDGKMNREQCARFVTGCTGNPCSQDEYQINKTFEQYDKDKDGFLTPADFIEFYTEAAKNKKMTVWQNLRTLNYRYDLVRGDRVQLPDVISSLLPRGQIVKSQKWLSLLFSLLDSPNVRVQEQAWYLLRRLPPSPNYFKQIVTFEDIRNEQDWDRVLSSNSNFRLLYSLHIIEFLMSNDTSNNSVFLALLEAHEKENDPTIEPEPLQLKSQESVLKLKDKWMSEFLQLGGFDRLFRFFRTYQNKSILSLDIIEKEILSFLLKTFSQYLVAACYQNKKPYYRAYQLMSQPQNLEVVLKNLRDSSSYPEPPELLALIEKLSEGGLAQNIIEKFALEEFIVVLTKLVEESLLKLKDLESEDRAIIEYSLNSIIIIQLFDKQIASKSLLNEVFISLLFNGLYTEKSINIRYLFARAILVWCHESQNTDSSATKLMLSQLVARINDEAQSHQIFELLSSLIDSASDHKDFHSFIDLSQLTAQLLIKLNQHESLETPMKNTPVDYILLGLLNLLDKIFSTTKNIVDSDELSKLIFSNCLFSLDQFSTVKCKSQESRKAAFKLLYDILNEKKNYKIINNELAELSLRIPKLTNWNYLPATEMRSPHGFAGIRNLGTICYMSAMLQQFYMTPTFRYGILLADDQQQKNLQKRPKDGQMVDDNILHQLQNMFAYLELSDRVDYNPQDFCFAFKDFSGLPVNVLIQQDAQEFLNMIFDKLENALKGTPYKKLLDGVYGGKTCTQLTCSECNYVRNKEEQFYNLSLTIKNLKNLDECFEKYIEGEVISDFKCDSCSKKVDVTKRQVLSNLPNVLILHLQRLVFNLDTLQNEKINSRLEFPIELNLQKYTLSQQENSQYKLVGVVVHFGTAEFGHYYSYIDIKKNDQWLEFNDSKIKEFKPKQIEKECFGGTSSDSGFGSSDEDMWGWGRMNRENSQNAYILVYEKVAKDPIELIFDNKEQFTGEEALSTSEEQDGKFHVKLDYYGIKPYVPETLKQMVVADNKQLFLERTIFDQDLLQFILQITDDAMKLQEVEDTNYNTLSLINVLIKFSFDLIAHAYDTSLLDQYCERLIKLLTQKKELCYEFLRQLYLDKPYRVVELLLSCPEAKTRKFYSSLLAMNYNQVIQEYQLSLQLEEDENENENENEEKQQSELKNINIKVALSLKSVFSLLMEQVPKNWIRFEQYFQFWNDLMNGGEVQKEWMLRTKMITYLLDFMLEKQSPLHLYEKKHQMVNAYTRLNFTNVFSIVYGLASKCFEENSKFQLSQNDRQLIFYFKLHDKLIKNLANYDFYKEFLKHFINNNQYFSEIICGCVLRALNAAESDDIKSVLEILKLLVTFDDKYKQRRIEWLFGVPQIQHHSHIRAYDPKTQKNDIHFYGTFGMTNLDEDIWVFPSPIGWQQTLLNYIITSKSSKQFDNQCLIAMKFLLELAIEDETIFKYASHLPSPNYIFRKFEDMIQQYLDTYISDNKKNYCTFSRENEQEEMKKCLEIYLQKINENKELFKCERDYLMGKTIEIHQSRKYIYVIDKNNVKHMISDEDDEKKKLLNDPFVEKMCTLEDRIYKAFICDNLPNGYTNEALPSLYVKGSQFFTFSVDPKSMGANFIQPKIWNTPNPTFQLDDECSMDFECIRQVINQITEIGVSEQNLVKNPRISPCIRQFSVTNNTNKSIQAILKFSGENSPHYLPESPIQSIIQSNNTTFMFATIKNKASDEFTPLQFELIYRIMDMSENRKDHHLYLSPEVEQVY